MWNQWLRWWFRGMLYPSNGHDIHLLDGVAGNWFRRFLTRLLYTSFHYGTVRLDTRRLITRPEYIEGEKGNVTRQYKHKEHTSWDTLRISRDQLIPRPKYPDDIPISLVNIPTTAVSPYWMNQRLQNKIHSQTPSLHRNWCHRFTSYTGSSGNTTWENNSSDNPAFRDETPSQLKRP